jgi:hypothetical protein
MESKDKRKEKNMTDPLNQNKSQKPEKGSLGTPIPAPIVKPSDTKKKGKGK